MKPAGNSKCHSATSIDLEPSSSKAPQLVIGCDCILRALELEEKQQKAEAGRLLAANNVIGFNTFGEQFQAMHVNQTFTGAAIGMGVADKSTWVS